MKNRLKNIAYVAICTIFIVSNSLAQATDSAKTQKKTPDAKARFTDEQKSQLKVNKEQRKLAQKEFRATFNTNQKAIIADKSVSREEKLKNLEPTLSSDQELMWQKNKSEAKNNNTAFKKSLSPEQKKMVKNKSIKWREKNKNKNDKSVKDSLSKF